MINCRLANRSECGPASLQYCEISGQRSTGPRADILTRRIPTGGVLRVAGVRLTHVPAVTTMLARSSGDRPGGISACFLRGVRLRRSNDLLVHHVPPCKGYA